MNPNFFDQFLHKYPYSNLHELNLDWLIAAVKELAAEIHDFELVNQFSFEGEWNITRQYKPYSIVTDDNAGYISIQPVPAGIPITDNRYWSLIADYTALIGNLGNRVVHLENQMAAPKKTYILIGDSFSLGVVGGGQPRGIGWAMYAEEHIPEFHERCFRYHPEEHEPIEGVASFAGGLFLQYLQAAGEELTCPADEVTDIVVLGGSNEFGYNQTSIEIGITDFCDYCKETYINAHIHIGLIGLQADRLFNEVYPAYKNGAIKNGAEYIDTCLNLMLNPSFDSGYGHITSDGYNFINPYVMEAIRFGRTTYNINFDVDATVNDTDVSIETGSFTFKTFFRITEKTIKIDLDDSTRYNPFMLKLNSHAGSSSIAGTAFTLAADTYLPLRDVGEIKIYLRDVNGYTYTPVRSGHMYIDEHNKIKYSAGFPYFNTWSNAGCDNPDNGAYIVWDRSFLQSI